MKFIKYFETTQERQTCTDVYKYMSYTDEDKVVNIHPYDYSKDYLTFVAKSSGTFNFSGSSNGSTANAIQYSTDNGETWSDASSSITVNVNSGDKVLWKGSNLTPYTKKGIGAFSESTANFDAEGNIMSLLFGDNYAEQTSLNGMNYAFNMLFYNTKVINTHNLIIQATTLSSSCYRSMFASCTLLTTAPSLPATTLASACYDNMFYYCDSLTTAPKLPATTLASYCYQFMFNGCTSLTKAPELPATTLTQSCYINMFLNCTSLTTAPQLPATTLATYCYSNMFQGCTSLTQAPQLPATTLANNCYPNMFQDCTNLTQAPQLPATTLTSSCYSKMFSGCTSLTTAPQLPATTLARSCYFSMFQGCTSLT